jgi:prepilin-type N-terminal cleavage/methylation domain-containing protein/prepilin-type processing-associated H-X9-DG protein
MTSAGLGFAHPSSLLAELLRGRQLESLGEIAMVVLINQQVRIRTTSFQRFIPSRRAFTLIELLIVIAVLGILSALLLPAIGRAKQAGISAKCKSNLRQMGIALSLYTSDYEHYPVLSSVHLLLDARSNRLGDLNRTCFCPSRLRKYEMPYIYNNFPGWQFPAAAVPPPAFLGGNFTSRDGGQELVATRETAVRVPSEMIAFTDGAYYATFDTLRPAQLNVSGDYPWTGTEDIYPHASAVNRVFCDGHVGAIKKREIAMRSDTIRRQWFTDNLPHRELVP